MKNFLKNMKSSIGMFLLMTVDYWLTALVMAVCWYVWGVELDVMYTYIGAVSFLFGLAILYIFKYQKHKVKVDTKG